MLNNIETTYGIAKFCKKGWSKILLVLEKIMMQWCFGWFKCKQVKMMLGNDEFLRKMNLMMLGSSHDSSCHSWSFEESRTKRWFQLVLDSENELRNMSRWRNHGGLFKGLWCFSRKNPIVKNAMRENGRVSGVAAVNLGFEVTENNAYIVCLGSLIHMVS